MDGKTRAVTVRQQGQVNYTAKLQDSIQPMLPAHVNDKHTSQQLLCYAHLMYLIAPGRLLGNPSLTCPSPATVTPGRGGCQGACGLCVLCLTLKITSLTHLSVLQLRPVRLETGLTPTIRDYSNPYHVTQGQNRGYQPQFQF